MLIRVKFDGGKQINCSQRGSWNGRCAGAGLHCNEGPTWGPTCWQKITGNAPNEIFEAKSQALQKQTTHDRKRKASETVKEYQRKRKFTSNDDDINSRRAYSKHDGIIEVDNVHTDLPLSDLQDLMGCYYRSNVVVTESTAASILLTTIKHSSDGRSLALWKEQRQLRITSSNVGKIAKHRSTTKVGQLVHQLLYSTFKGNKATSWGLLQEEDTEKQYQQFMEKQSKDFLVSGDCGLAVSTQHPRLAATPDDFVNDPNAIPQLGCWSTRIPMPIEIA